MTKLSIITVCFNAEKHLKKTLDSVLNQEFEDYEYIVIDGASTDGTLAVLRKNQNKRLRIVSEPDSGVYHALNKGI